jgi:hypothetical protein
MFLRSAAQMFYRQQKIAKELETLLTWAFLKQKLRMALSTPARGDITRYLADSTLLLEVGFVANGSIMLTKSTRRLHLSLGLTSHS